VIVVDTGAVLALLDVSEYSHRADKKLFDKTAASWILPSAILPEVDYLVSRHLGPKAQEAFFADLADGLFAVEWGRQDDLATAQRICARYPALRIGFVDAMVMATAERLKAEAIATLDVRHFAAVQIKGNPRLLPRDS